ncbi:MAG: endonuclease [Oscillospiraceae bacterium]|nr:endonuclease [Oscillospiraceae bacterium]
MKIKSVLKIFAVFIGLVLVLAIGLVGWLTVTEFNPDEVEEQVVFGDSERKTVLNEKITVLTFNMGYGNLGKEADSFLDGGKDVRSGDKETVLENLEGIKNLIKEKDADILLIQEVDEDSKRSYGINQVKILGETAGGEYSLGHNYVCDYVPFPIPTIGKVRSGVMTVSDFETEKAERISLPCPFSWPVSAANLKRCLLVTYYDIEGTDKKLAVINLHLEAYDDGEGKIAQTKMLWEILKSEYAKGNYVIAGGDFNQTFPGSLEKYPIKNPELWTPGILEESDLPDGWQYVYDDSNPTCRLLNEPYNPESENTQYYIIDGFIISPNVELLSVETINMEFEYSDHNPVLMEIILK